MNQRMNNEENITDEIILLPGDPSAIAEPMVPIEEQVKGLKESKLDRMLAAVDAPVTGPLPVTGTLPNDPNTLIDIAKGATQLGLETVGLANRLMPREDPSGEKSDYYGWTFGEGDATGKFGKLKEFLSAPITDLIPNFWKQGMMETGYEGGITIPLSEIEKYPELQDHMYKLHIIDLQNAVKELADQLPNLDFSESLMLLTNPNANQMDTEKAGSLLYEKLRDNEISMEDKQIIADALDEKESNPFYHKIDADGKPTFNPEEAESIVFNYMPYVDEGMFGMDMTLDPQTTESGDISLPGSGVWGMRDGELRQVAASTMRPLDEMGIWNIPKADWVKENITDKVAWQGPAMHQPEGTGIGYQLPMLYALGRGVVLPALKGAYKYPKTAAGISALPISAAFAKKALGED